MEATPKVLKGNGDVQTFTTVEALNHSDFLCRNYILNVLHDLLYNVYNAYKSLKNFGNFWTENKKLRMSAQRNVLLDNSLMI